METMSDGHEHILDSFHLPGGTRVFGRSPTIEEYERAIAICEGERFTAKAESGLALGDRLAFARRLRITLERVRWHLQLNEARERNYGEK